MTEVGDDNTVTTSCGCVFCDLLVDHPEGVPCTNSLIRHYRNDLPDTADAQRWSSLLRAIKRRDGHIASLEAENASLRTQVSDLQKAGEWKDIESAPKDGTRILVWRPFEKDVCVMDRPAHAGIDLWRDDTWFKSRRNAQPTHWLPIPSPPVSAEVEK